MVVKCVLATFYFPTAGRSEIEPLKVCVQNSTIFQEKGTIYCQVVQYLCVLFVSWRYVRKKPLYVLWFPLFNIAYRVHFRPVENKKKQLAWCYGPQWKTTEFQMRKSFSQRHTRAINTQKCSQQHFQGATFLWREKKPPSFSTKKKQVQPTFCLASRERLEQGQHRIDLVKSKSLLEVFEWKAFT